MHDMTIPSKDLPEGATLWIGSIVVKQYFLSLYKDRIEYYHCPYWCYADTMQEAQKKALCYAGRIYPQCDGYVDHYAIVQKFNETKEGIS